MDTILIGDFDFTFDDNGEKLISVKKKKFSRKMDLIIPSKIGEKPIRIIAENCFVSLKLNTLDLSELNVSELLPHTFDKISILDELFFPETLKIIGNYCFHKCHIAKSTLPDCTETIGSHAFEATGINVSFPEKTEIEIGAFAFLSCHIASLTIYPLWKLKTGSFQECNLQQLKISSGVTVIPKQTFAHNEIKELTLPESVTSIGWAAFYHNNISFLDIKWGNINSLGSSAFKYNDLFELNLSDFIGEIPDSCFSFNKITNVTLGDYITMINERAFSDNCMEDEPKLPRFLSFLGNNVFEKMIK